MTAPLAAQPVTIPEHRKPADIDSPELIAMFRHARALLDSTPGAQLSRGLANFMWAARHELRRRGECDDEYLYSA
ncbi:hypothetical protein [Trebonia sp.]|uniref:hypothetical protein n=1 Tax=Trebonia sp. TaxID=2767075 RepID=UPI0026198F8E|nr:hypothetical protein [Trebonia sp.]